MTKSLVEYLYKAAGWMLIFTVMTELFLRSFIILIPSNNAIQNGGGLEVRGQEGYGILYYLPNREIASPYNDAKAKNIIVLGDSFTHAPHVMFWKNFTSVAENKLYDQDLTGCNLRNFGRRRLNLAHYLGMGKSIMEVYNPAAIVIQVTPADVIDAGFQRKDTGFYFEELQNGNIVLQQGENFEDLIKTKPFVSNPAFSFSSLFDLSRSSIQYAIELQNENLFPDTSPNQEPVQVPLSNSSEARATRLKKIITLIESTFKDVPIIFVLIPRPNEYLSLKQNVAMLRLKTALEKNSNWAVVYPFDEFLNTFQQGYPPHGFGNTKPMSGHINSTGHLIIGEKLAEQLRTLSLCE